MEDLILDWLESATMPGLSKRAGGNLLEACLVCLEHSGHRSGKELRVNDGENLTIFKLVWRDSLGIQERRSYADMQEATEWGACGLACLLVFNIAGLVVTRRSRKGTGFDYWLSRVTEGNAKDATLFQDEARLEVSGILKEERETVITNRARQKLKQVTGGERTDLPAHIVIVEFSKPLAKMVHHERPNEGKRTA